MLSSFSFHLPTRIEVGKGILSKLADFMKQTVKGKRILIITDPGIQKAGIVEPILAALLKEGYELSIFDQVQPNPKDIDCVAGGKMAQEFCADAILAVGGGSVLDSAKMIAVLHTHGGTPQDYEGRGKIHREVTPIIAVPTTAGTGSEVTRSSVITDTKRHFKMTIKDVKLAPALAIVDPETTYRLPAAITASTGMDALVHAIEAYTCQVANPISDSLALGAMERIYPWLRMAVADGGNSEARYQMMVGSLIAGMAFSHADVASVHCMAEALGGLYDTPHGVANSIFLPVVTAYNAPCDPVKHARVARACGLPVQGMTDEEAARCLVEAMDQLGKDIGIPTLRSLGYVREEDFPRLAEASFENGSTPSNAREIRTADYLELFQVAYRK